MKNKMSAWIFVGVLVLLAGLTVVIISNRRSTPQYALAQIWRGLLTNDAPKFYTYIDGERLPKDLTRQMLSVSDQLFNSAGLSSFEKLLGSQILAARKEQIASFIKTSLDSLVIYNKLRTTGPDTAGVSLYDWFVLHLDPQTSTVKYVTIRDTLCDLATSAYDPATGDTDLMQVKMRLSKNGKWVLVSIPNWGIEAERASAAMQKLQSNQARAVAMGMAKSVSLVSWNYTTSSEDYGLDEYLNLSITFRNDTSIAISNCKLDVGIYDVYDKLLKEKTLQFQGPLQPHRAATFEWRLDLNPFIDTDKEIYGAGQLRLNYYVLAIRFADGTVMTLANPAGN